jgi:hypothetical protein
MTMPPRAWSPRAAYQNHRREGGGGEGAVPRPLGGPSHHRDGGHLRGHLVTDNQGLQCSWSVCFWPSGIRIRIRTKMSRIRNTLWIRTKKNGTLSRSRRRQYKYFYTLWIFIYLMRFFFRKKLGWNFLQWMDHLCRKLLCIPVWRPKK